MKIIFFVLFACCLAIASANLPKLSNKNLHDNCLRVHGLSTSDFGSDKYEDINQQKIAEEKSHQLHVDLQGCLAACRFQGQGILEPAGNISEKGRSTLRLRNVSDREINACQAEKFCKRGGCIKTLLGSSVGNDSSAQLSSSSAGNDAVAKLILFSTVLCTIFVKNYFHANFF